VIGRPASSSQNMIWRYSSSATVACWEVMARSYRPGEAGPKR
jgi:hypothetical protein